MTTEPTLTVGTGVTYYCGSDRYAYTVIEFLSPTKLVVQQDTATLVSKNEKTGESQKYTFAPNPNGQVVDISLRKNGLWYPVGEKVIRGCYYKPGDRRQYSDPGY